MTRVKSLIFAATAIGLSLAATTALLLALDLYAHHRVERSAGLNWRGFRGPTVARKQPGELRVAMLGGSTVFGYGVAWDETIPAALERDLRAKLPHRKVSVINLGLIGAGVYSFLPTLQDFEDLQIDVVCLYEGYNDLLGDHRPNIDLIRHESTVFRLTGYFPVLPLVLWEKWMALRFGTVDAAYARDRERERQGLFRPDANKGGGAMKTASEVSKALARQLETFARPLPPTEATGKAGCAAPWVHYCDFLYAAVDHATARGKGVVIGTQPLLTTQPGLDRQTGQQQALADLYERILRNDPRIRLVDLSKAINLGDEKLAFDGMHLTAPGNELIASGLLDAVLAVAESRARE